MVECSPTSLEFDPNFAGSRQDAVLLTVLSGNHHAKREQSGDRNLQYHSTTVNPVISIRDPR